MDDQSMAFSDLLAVIAAYGRNSRQHLHEPAKFEEDRQEVKRFFAEHGVELDLDA